jgi:hypothetical protein
MTRTTRLTLILEITETADSEPPPVDADATETTSVRLGPFLRPSLAKCRGSVAETRRLAGAGR